MEAWASEVGSLMMTMDLAHLEEVSEVETCSSKYRWEVAWVVAWEVEDLVHSNPHPFQVEAPHNRSRQKRL